MPLIVKALCFLVVYYGLYLLASIISPSFPLERVAEFSTNPYVYTLAYRGYYVAFEEFARAGALACLLFGIDRFVIRKTGFGVAFF